MSPIPLPSPALYFPFRSGKYEVAANLKRLGRDFGNGNTDKLIFQIDDQWERYLRNKNQSRNEELAKYVCFSDFNASIQQAVNQWLLHQLVNEHPTLFSLSVDEQHHVSTLYCQLSQRRLRFNAHYELMDADAPYQNGFDALAMQIQEDITVVKIEENGEDKLIAAHLCFPNHWAAQDKIGRSFLSIHQPVAEFSRIAQHAAPLMRNMIQAGTYVRFAWGIATDTHLNHHPQAPAHHPARPDWRGRQFDITRPEAYLRIERQTLTGLPQVGAFVFTIRTYFQDIDQLENNDKQLLAAAIHSMSDEVLRYKGLASYSRSLTDWLQSTAEAS